jgi:hypothetical protein
MAKSENTVFYCKANWAILRRKPQLFPPLDANPLILLYRHVTIGRWLNYIVMVFKGLSQLPGGGIPELNGFIIRARDQQLAI